MYKILGPQIPHPGRHVLKNAKQNANRMLDCLILDKRQQSSTLAQLEHKKMREFRCHNPEHADHILMLELPGYQGFVEEGGLTIAGICNQLDCDG